MAYATLNPIFKRISGRIGSLVFYHYNNRQYIRRYVVPRNPDTPAQRYSRARFAEAVLHWQGLVLYKKEQWNNRALRMRMSGYNLYISGKMTNQIESGPVETVQQAGTFDSSTLLPASHSVYGITHVRDGCYRDYT